MECRHWPHISSRPPSSTFSYISCIWSWWT